MKATLGLVLVLGMGGTVLAGDLEARIVAYPKEVPRGIAQIPLIVGLHNTSGHPLTIGLLWAELQTTDGQGHRTTDPRMVTTSSPGGALIVGAPPFQTVPAGWSYYRKMVVGYTDPPGPPREMVIQLVVYPRSNEDGPDGGRLWSGELRPEPVRIVIQDPVGVDRQAGGLGDDWKLHKKLLQRYPTSTYAAYVIYNSECCGGSALNDPKAVLDSIADHEASGRKRFASLPNPDEGEDSLWGDDVGRWCDRWTQTVLEAHPNIWFADQLRITQGVNALWRKDYDTAAERFRVVARDAEGLFGERAQQFLAVMAERAMIPGIPHPGR